MFTLTLRKVFGLIIVSGLLSLAACGPGVSLLRLYVPLHQQFDPASVASIFVEQSGLRVVPANEVAGVSALDALTANDTDLTLLENSVAFVTGVRAVLPVYKSVLHVLLREGFKPPDPDKPMRGASIFVAAHSVAGNSFVDLVTRRQGLAAEDYRRTEVFEPGVTDIVIYFGPIDPGNSQWFHSGYELVSPGKRLSPAGKFSRERVAYIVPNMKPEVIPAYTYDFPGNHKPLATVSVDTLLVTRKEVPAAVVYELTRTLLEQKPRFTAVAPHLFSGINESFDPLNLSFPLHVGARRYLERDEPSLLERYAESINMLVYVTFLLMTGFLALARWRAQRKKDRVDVFYEKVLAIRGRVGQEQTQTLEAELAELEREAFGLLVKERLAADESFRIFTDLLAQARAELHAGADPH